MLCKDVHPLAAEYRAPFDSTHAVYLGHHDITMH